MAWLGKKPADVIASGQTLAPKSVTADRLADGAAVANVGYTPVNKAGDTMTGRLVARDTVNVDPSFPFGIQNGSQQQWWLRAETTSNRFSISRNGLGNVIQADDSGRVTMPYQPFFQGYINSRFTVASGSPTKVASNIGVANNVGGHWNNYRFTCPVSGVYEVHSGWMKETSTTLAIHWDVSINGQGGNSYRRIRSWEGNGYFYLSNTWLITLSANDYIEFFAYAGGAGQQIYEEHSSIYIRLVG